MRKPHRHHKCRRQQEHFYKLHLNTPRLPKSFGNSQKKVPFHKKHGRWKPPENPARPTCSGMPLRSQAKSPPRPGRVRAVSARSRRQGGVSGRRGCQLFGRWTFTLQSRAAEDRIHFRNKCKRIILFTTWRAAMPAARYDAARGVFRYKNGERASAAEHQPPRQTQASHLPSTEVARRLTGILGAGGGSGSSGTRTLPGLKKSMSWVRLTTHSWDLIPRWQGHPSTHVHVALNTITTAFTESIPLRLGAASGFLQVWQSVHGDYRVILGNVHADDTLTRDGEVLNDTLQYHFLKNSEASNIPFWIAQREVWVFTYFLKGRMIFNGLVSLNL